MTICRLYISFLLRNIQILHISLLYWIASPSTPPSPSYPLPSHWTTELTNNLSSERSVAVSPNIHYGVTRRKTTIYHQRTAVLWLKLVQRKCARPAGRRHLHWIVGIHWEKLLLNMTKHHCYLFICIKMFFPIPIYWDTKQPWQDLLMVNITIFYYIWRENSLWYERGRNPWSSSWD